MPINPNTSSFIGTEIEELFGQMVLGAETVDKGLLHVFPDKRNKVYLDRFRLGADVLTTRVAEPTPNAVDYAKDERVITPGSHEFYQEFDPRAFGIDNWKYLWPTGPDVDPGPANELRAALLKATIDRVQEGVDTNIWQGDIAAGTDPLQITDGYIKIMSNDVTVIDTTPAPITEANVITVFEAVLAAATAAMREKGSPTLICDHATKYAYEAAARALDVKGSNITERITPIFGGFPIVSVGGMPASTIVFTDASSGGNLKMSTWMTSDLGNLQIEPKNAHSDLWFVRFAMDFGVNYVNGEEVVLHVPA